MILTWEFLFWGFLALIIYTYLGYGLLLYIGMKIKRLTRSLPAPPKEDYEPEVTIVIAAYNEGIILEEKILNTLALDYPPHKIRVLLVTDGSDDNTAEIAARYPLIGHEHQPERQGKIAAVSRVMPQVTTPITVFTDANTLLNPAAIRNMVKHFVSPQIGAVAGEKRVKSEKADSASGAGEGLYWKYESLLKTWDAELYSVVGAAGELFAIRTELFVQLPADTLIEDFVLTLDITRRGFRVAYAPDAFAEETPSDSVSEELKRKVRISAGGLQAVWRLRSLLNPFRYGILTFQYVSHRVLRWTLAPIGLLVVFFSNLLLAGQGEPLYQWLIAGQILFYLAAVAGYLLENRRIRLKLLFVPFYFCLMNYAVFAGFVRLIRGKQSVIWEKAARRS
ncbi:MAG: glycosyltransferase family 2 protein [Bacteroidia bacterium]|nr:glycosyltransferase family 2 protein [Bacteroidia bacterium]